MLRLSLARRSISREVQTPRRHLGFGSGLAAARSGQDIRYCSLPNYFLTANIQTTLPCGTLLSISALLRKHDRLDRERAGILLLVVADDVGQLAFRDPRDIADLRHRDRLSEAVLDGLDLGLVAFYRDLVEFAVRPDRDAVEADAVLGWCEHWIRRPDLERGTTRLQAVHIGRERVGDIGSAVSADGNIVTQGFRIAECKTALRCAAGEIEDFQPGALGVAGIGNAKAGDVIGADIQHAAFLVGKHAEHRTTAGGAGLDELLCFPAGHGFHHTAKVEAAHIECAVLGGCHAFRKTSIRDANRRGLGTRSAASRDAEREYQSGRAERTRAAALEQLSQCKRAYSYALFLIHD